MDAESIYDVPLLMRKEKLDERVLSKLKLTGVKADPDLDTWKDFLGKLKNPTSEINIGLVGKYAQLPDAYKSITEAFIHAGAVNETKVKVRWIQSDDLSADNMEYHMRQLDGILVAPGFGSRGIEGKVAAVKHARENNIPFFGICLGMQIAVVEFARNVMGHKEANSTEMNPDTEYPVIALMESQKNVTKKGGTMRLGSYTCELVKGSKAYGAYGKTKIHERHRHRYEFNNKYLKAYEKAGMIATGINPEGNLVEIVELKDHPFFVGAQFHPELKSTVLNPHPLFVKFIKSALEYSKNK